MFREHKNPKNITFIKELLPKDFYAVLRKTSCLVGNSSCGIKESSYIGVPVVNIGTRQNGRVRAKNVLDVGYNKKEIRNAIKTQMKNGFYKPSHLYYKPDTSKIVVKILSEIEPETQKAFFD